MKNRFAVYIDDKPLVFQPMDDRSVPDGYTIIAESEAAAEQLLERMQSDIVERGVVCLCEHPDKSWLRFAALFKLSVAAGGVVRNPAGKILVIFRRGKWDLPKGKLDYDETPEHAAVREVMEECGLEEVQLGIPVTVTYHTYSEKKKRILKKTHWYEMTTAHAGPLVPQVEEDIEKAEWMTNEEVRTIVFSNTYASIRNVLEQVL